VVPQNYSNTGTIGDFSLRDDADLTARDRVSLIVRHELSRYDLPNELVQQMAGQRQTADNLETMGVASYQHIFSPHLFADLRGMVRDNANDFTSNPQSIPIQVFQHNGFREGYFKASITIDHGRQEATAGAESDNTFLNENFRYLITIQRSSMAARRRPSHLRRTVPTWSSQYMCRISCGYAIGPSAQGFAGTTINCCSIAKLCRRGCPWRAISRPRTW